MAKCTSSADARWTPAAARHWAAQDELIGLIGFMVSLVDHIDELSIDGARFLAKTASDDTEKEHYERLLQSRRTLRGQLGGWGGLLREIYLVRFVDSFLCYVSESLAALFLARPELLRSSEKVDVAFVLSHGSMEELVAVLAERRVERLAYKGVGDLAAYLEEGYGLPLFPTVHDRDLAILAVDQRNLAVHNRGVVNRRWLRQHGEGHGKLGEPLTLDGDTVLEVGSLLARAVEHMDAVLSEKFGLEKTQPPSEAARHALERPPRLVDEAPAVSRTIVSEA